jgi:hypothetical protein
MENMQILGELLGQEQVFLSLKDDQVEILYKLSPSTPLGTLIKTKKEFAEFCQSLAIYYMDDPLEGIEVPVIIGNEFIFGLKPEIEHFNDEEKKLFQKRYAFYQWGEEQGIFKIKKSYNERELLDWMIEARLDKHIAEILIQIDEQNKEVESLFQDLIDNFTVEKYKHLHQLMGNLCGGSLPNLCKYARERIYHRFKISVPGTNINLPVIHWKCQACPYKHYHYSLYNKQRIELLLFMTMIRDAPENFKDELIEKSKAWLVICEEQRKILEKDTQVIYR